MCKIICVTNRRLCRGDFLQRIEDIAACQPDGILLREKDLSSAAYTELAEQVMRICRHHAVPCILHNFADSAKSLGSEYIHLPLSVLRALTADEKAQFSVIGASCHSPEEAQEAVSLGANYITAGHVFATDCKKGLPGRGTDFLREMCRIVNVPVYAIGGISVDTLGDVLAAGAAGGCVMSGFMQCENPADYMQQLRRKQP